jgi:hypothetical protein
MMHGSMNIKSANKFRRKLKKGRYKTKEEKELKNKLKK